MSKKINEICVQYANKYGGGLPLTPQEVCNATVLWVEEQLNNFTPPEGDGVTVDKLMELIKGSVTIVVDENEAGTALEIHLDYEVVAKLDRAILTPIASVEEDSVPVVKPNNSVEYKPVSELGGGTSFWRAKCQVTFQDTGFAFIEIMYNGEKKLNAEELFAYISTNEIPTISNLNCSDPDGNIISGMIVAIRDGVIYIIGVDDYNALASYSPQFAGLTQEIYEISRV